MKVSIILTSYNHEKFIKKSIESVLNQTYKDFRLIILDDCSSDSSWDIIQQFDDERIVAIRNPKNLRTEGFYKALHQYIDGTYLAVHHSDDEWVPDKLEKQVAFMDGHPDIAACFTQVQVIDEEENVYSDEEGFYYNLFNQKNRSRFEWLNYFFYNGNCLCHPSVMIRSHLFFQEEMFDFGFAQIPDFSRWVRICLRHDIYILPEKLTRFRIQNHGKNTSGNRADTIIRSSIEWFHLLHLYSGFQTQEEFVKVFPEGAGFAKKEAYIPEFAFARICTRPEMESYTRLFGYELLYKLMNDREKAERIEQVYGFTFRDLIRLTGEKDIFHVLEEEANQQMSVYLFDGKDDPVQIKKSYYLKDYYKFDWEIDIPEEYSKKKWKQIRFDPAERLYTICQIQTIQVDGSDFEIHAYNATDVMDGFQIFENLDPMYISDEVKQKISKIRICGEIKRFNYELQNRYHILESEKRNELFDEIGKRDTWIKQLQTEKQDVQQIRNEEKKELLSELQKTSGELQRISGELQEKSEQKKILEKSVADLSQERDHLIKNTEKIEKENQKLEAELEKVQSELAEIKQHKLYRIFKKITTTGGKK